MADMPDPAKRRGKYALTDIITSASGMEYSVHSCPKAYVSDLKSLFPSQDPSSLLIIPTCQKAHLDLLNLGPEVEAEKDRLLQQFMSWAEKVTKKLAASGAFADYIDPCSGLPMIHKGTNTYYGEVDALQTLLGYTVSTAGCCKVVLHPNWGSHVYPATLFTNAPLETFLEVAQSVSNAADPA